MPNNHDHELPAELLDLEQQLVDMVPSAICSDLQIKLEESMVAHVCSDQYMDSYHETHTHELQELEVHLKDIAPVSMPTDMLNRMVDAMDQWSEEPAEQNVIGFDDFQRQQPSKSGLFGIGFLSAAAAVALLAGVAALVVSDFSPESAGDLAAQSLSTSSESASFTPEASNVSSISAPSIGSGDTSSYASSAEILTSKVMSSREKIIYDKSENPYRFVEVQYMDEVKVKSPCGRDVILSRPRKDGYLIPIKVH